MSQVFRNTKSWYRLMEELNENGESVMAKILWTSLRYFLEAVYPCQVLTGRQYRGYSARTKWAFLKTARSIRNKLESL